MDDKEKTKSLDEELFSPQGADFMEVDVAKVIMMDLLSKVGDAWQSDEQQYYVLEGEEAKRLLEKLSATQPPQGFIQTSEWVPPAAQYEPPDDATLQKMGALLQPGTEPKTDDMHDCQCGDEVYVFPDPQAMQEFVGNLGASDAASYVKNTVWNKQQTAVDHKQLALLAEIADHLQAIETVLLRVEQLLKRN